MHGRNYILWEQNPNYCEMARKRISRAAYQMKLEIGAAEE
jgi:DNA modification methylase